MSEMMTVNQIMHALAEHGAVATLADQDNLELQARNISVLDFGT